VSTVLDLVGNVPDMSWTCLFLSLMSSNFGDMANVPGHGSWSVAQSRVWRACPPYKSRTKNALVVIRYLGALTQLIPAAGIKRARNTNNNNRPTTPTTIAQAPATQQPTMKLLRSDLSDPLHFIIYKSAHPPIASMNATSTGSKNR
jgi:hypothetical protein